MIVVFSEQVSRQNEIDIVIISIDIIIILNYIIYYIIIMIIFRCKRNSWEGLVSYGWWLSKRGHLFQPMWLILVWLPQQTKPRSIRQEMWTQTINCITYILSWLCIKKPNSFFSFNCSDFKINTILIWRCFFLFNNHARTLIAKQLLYDRFSGQKTVFV